MAYDIKDAASVMKGMRHPYTYCKTDVRPFKTDARPFKRMPLRIRSKFEGWHPFKGMPKKDGRRLTDVGIRL